MKGKNKLVLVLFAIMALVATSVGFALKGTVESIRCANAESIPGFTAKLDGDVIFSAESVYFATVWTDDGDNIPEQEEVIGWTDSDADGIIDIGEFKAEADLNNDEVVDAEELRLYNIKVRQSKVTYNGYNFNPIVTNNGVEYFGDYALTTNNYDYSNKKVIDNGDFVMVNDMAQYSAGDKIIKEGIMITLGGYYYNDDSIKTNYPNISVNDDINNNKIIDESEINPVAWNDENKNDKIDSGEVYGWVDKNNNKLLDVDEIPEVGANISYVSAVQATLNGEPITIPNSRDYNNASHEDFTWFIIPSEATEGHYKVSFLYSMKGFARPIPYEFEFYLLLQSSYDKQVEVNRNVYSSRPKMTNAEGDEKAGYSFYSGTSLNYPMLTFDYSRYDLSYTHTSGDVTTEVDFEYNESVKTLNLSYKLYDDVEQEPYIINTDINNTIVTLMFVDQGRYDFHFDYIYNKGNKITIPQEQIPFENIELNIYGYQLKYSKAGFTSADMTHLNIYQNGTMFVLINGFTNTSNKATGDDLGVSYTLITPTVYNQRTGIVADYENVNKNEDSESAIIVKEKDAEDIDKLIAGNKIDEFVKSIYDNSNKDKIINNYQRTDRGLWLTLKDEYHLTNSFYYYNATSPISTDYVTAGKTDENYVTTYTNRKDFTKVTTFTAPGYYLVQVKYNIEGQPTTDYIQYFAFQITSTTPMLDLYKTDLEVLAGELVEGKDYFNFYAKEYTNKNVYANWAETEIFESKVSGKLYYVEGKYAEESTLKAVADGGFNSSVTALEYKKNDIIKDSGAYLLVLEVEKSATKTYTYFKIDKEQISGLKVYEVITRSIDNSAVYSIRQDKNLNYIEHTEQGVIDTLFTISWDDKASGAGITATYKFTPFIKSNQEIDKNPVPVEEGDNKYVYMINQYTIGSRSANISIQKPTRLNVSLDVNKVLTDQGIYEFNLVDQAGNELNYIVIVDGTESLVKATYGEADENGKKKKYTNGQLVADYVELEWGTHKAISLGEITQKIDEEDNVIYKLLNNQSIDNYYTSGINNLSNLYKMFTTIKGQNLFAVQNMYTDIKIDQAEDHYYRLTYQGTQQMQYSNGSTVVGWDKDGDDLFDNATNWGIKINVDTRDGGEDHIYNFEIKGSNQVGSTSSTKFTVRITPDEALGQVYSTSQDGGQYDTYVHAKGIGTKYFGDGTLNHTDYYEAQASNDGVFVFEWVRPKEGEDNFRVTQVKYNYYQLMDQETLNTITIEYIKDDNGRYVFNQSTNKYIEYDASKHSGMQRYTTNYPYYPYRYVEVSNNDILKTEENDVESISAYTTAERITKDDNGKIIESRQVYRSDAINLAYESYYNSKGELVTQQVTQTGLYIITRTIAMTSNVGEEGTTMEYSYAFFVDRNMIVGYAINDINTKIVGQFIHTAMPNSDAENGVKYDNFNKQGLKEKTIECNGETIKYKVYLETNKLPTLLQVPSGKYVSGIYNPEDKNDRQINLTSHLNLELKLSVYFKDTYNILPENYKGASVKLMSGVTSNKNGYIDLSFSNIDEGMITVFKNARIQTDDNKLSLPGEYVFVIEDTVGHILDKQFNVIDVNKFIFGIKLTNNSPVTDVYSYANINGNKSSNVYVDGKQLYTNQEFVDFVIPVEDKNAYDAQLDIATIEILRSDLSNKPWLRLVPSNSGNGFTADTSGHIQDISRVEIVKDKDGNPINYIIHLDTELVVENNKIVDYEEFVYTINIQYILTNTNYTYYEYKKNNDKISFYSTTYTVVIDRTPNSFNLDALMKEQGDYFEGYQTWLAKQNGAEISGDINKTVAYRNTTTTSDYYGLINELYYKFAHNVGDLSNQAMYALTVDYNSTFNPSELSNIYYREIKVASSSASEADKRMGLLPISDIYGEGYYHSFNENMKAYSSYSISNTDFKDAQGNIYYRAIMGDNGNNYDANWGRFYEVVEKDMAGNLTQYVIYFAPTNAQDVSIVIEGDIIGSEDIQKTITFANSSNENQTSFTGINDVKKVIGIVGSSVKDDTSKNLYPYYSNINIYNALRDKSIKTIYTNSTSIHNEYDSEGNKTVYGFEQEIYDIIKNEGNHIIEFVNVFGKNFYVTVNNYTSDIHRLNIATLQRQEDYQTGQDYVKFSGLNSKINNNDTVTYWYVTEIDITYNNKTISYTAGVPEAGISVLEYSSSGNIAENEVVRDIIEKDRLNLAPNTQYMIKLTDVGGNIYYVPISTTDGYYAHKLDYPNNIYVYDNIYYTANEVVVSYNAEHYTWNMSVEEIIEEKGVVNDYTESTASDNNYFEITEKDGYYTIKLLPDSLTEPADHYGSLRIFKVWLSLKGVEDNSLQTQDPTYTIYIDTRTTDFIIENTHKVGKIDYIKSTLKNGSDGDYNDYDEIGLKGLIDSKYYEQLIDETVNISWTRLQSDYFTYEYELYEFANAVDKPVELLQGSIINEYPIEPKDNTTGKYIFKVTIRAKDKERTWIATRIYGIYMSTTITGLYEVKDGDGNLYDYASITNLDEIYYDTNSFFSNSSAVAGALNFVKDNPAGGKTSDVEAMEKLFESFGKYTAIPMYIANTELTLHSNADNGVSSWSYKYENAYSIIILYRVWRANYQTFAVTMYVKPETNKNIINTFSFKTTADEDAESLLNIGTAKTIYNDNAEFYQLTFNSYNINTRSNKLEQHNTIVIDVYYNNGKQWKMDETVLQSGMYAVYDGHEADEQYVYLEKGAKFPKTKDGGYYLYFKRIKGDSVKSITSIEFNNSGSYKLVITDMAGNIQTFNNQEFFTLVLMKKNDMLYTINGEAPIQYAYYDSAVTLQINRYNEATGKNNYDINTINIKVKRNSINYTGYEHPTESATYIFRDYGTYLVTMSAKLLETGELVTAQLVFTIINPNETRSALDFTSIYGYNIISVFSITKTTEKDVTDKFIDLLKDKSNDGEVNAYNKLITYERVVEAIGTATQGKIKLRVVYEVKNDDLLPSRIAEFSFTLNNEKATITSSIAPGGKTTKTVTLKFNAANIYDQVGECYLVINGERVKGVKIDSTSVNAITEVQVKEVGRYYVQLVGDSGNVIHSFNFTIKQPLNTVSIILIVVVVAIVIALIGTFIWLRTRMKVR